MKKALKSPDIGALGNRGKKGLRYHIKKYGAYYVMLIPLFIFLIIFCYVPMGGTVMAFQDFRPVRGFFKSDWVGLENFIDVFSRMQIEKLILQFQPTMLLVEHDVRFQEKVGTDIVRVGRY